MLYFPTVVAPITVSYNLDVDGLQLSADTIAKIFQREITNWNDAAIAADNPDATLPDQAITVVPPQRLSAAPPATSPSSSRRPSVPMPAASGRSAPTPPSSGPPTRRPARATAASLADLIDTKGAIGYVDLSDARPPASSSPSIKNKAGKFVEPTLEGASAAAEGAEIKPTT